MSAWLERVLVRDRAHTRLHELTLGLGPGSLTAVVGGDGAGKSTLLGVLVGAVAPTSGRVHVPPRERIGFVSSAPGVYPDMTVEENLRFAGAGYDVRGRELAGRITELLEVTGLELARDRLASRLSGGMRQKLAFACAVLHRPRLLVMDEPTTGLDPISRADLWRLVSATLTSGAVVVFSTTYVDEAARADQVVVLDEGHAIAEGTPEEIRARLPGRVVRVDRPVEGVASWRRGRTRHAWIPSGAPPAGSISQTADLEDAVIVAALARRDRTAREARHDAA